MRSAAVWVAESVEFLLQTIFARARVPSSDGEGPGSTPESRGAIPKAKPASAESRRTFEAGSSGAASCKGPTRCTTVVLHGDPDSK